MIERCPPRSMDYLAVACAALILYAPVLLFGAPMAHDGETYAGWFLAFRETLAAGTPDPRWLPSMNDGAGGPAFFFYPPLAFYGMAVIDIVLESGRDVLARMGQGLFPFYLASGLGFLWAARPSLGRIGALIGAVAYHAMPYHDAVDLWLRADYAEFAAYAFAPLCAGFFLRLSSGPAAIAGLAVSLAAMIVTHVPTALILLYALGGIALCHALILRSAIGLGRFAAAASVGILLAGFYLVPAIAMQDLVSIDHLWSAPYRPGANFLFSSTDPHASLLLAALAGETVAVFAVLAILPREILVGQPVRWLAAIAAIAWLFMLPVSAIAWDVLPFLAKVQFPWRVGIVLDLALAALAGIAGREILAAGRRADRVLAAGALCLIAAASAPPLYSGHLGQLPFMEPAVRENVLEAIGTRRDPPEYRLAGRAAPDRPRPRVTVLAGRAEVVVTRWESRDIALEVTAGSTAEIVVRQAYMPLWRAVLADGSPLPIARSEPDGLHRILVPAGHHVITLTMVRAGAEIVGLWLSVAGIAGLALLFVLAARNRRSVSRTAPPSDPTVGVKRQELGCRS